MPSFDTLAGAVIDEKYRVERRLGSGGMGGVFLATHLGTSRSVALKLITPRFASDATFVERFRREARAAGRLRHPNIVDVTDFGSAEVEGERIAYLVMEYLDGCSLADVLEEDRRLPLDWVVEFFDQLALAIDEAHRQGVVHRDLKPANIWLEPDRRGSYRVKVLDFGLAKLADPGAAEPNSSGEAVASDLAEVGGATSLAGTLPMATYPTASDHTLPYRAHDEPALVERDPAITSAPTAIKHDTAADTGENRGRETALTRAGTLMGTPPYMSPEQARGEAAGPASDIYSLGVLVYEMLAGAPPFEGDFATLLRKHAGEEPEPLALRAPAVPKRVSDVVMSALGKDPATRPASATLFAAALRSKAESWRGLFRRAIVLCAERYPLFLRISFATGLPFFLVHVLEVANVGLREFGAMAHIASGLASLPLGILALVTGFLGSVLSKSMAVVVLAQLLLAPLRKARVRLAASLLVRNLGRIALGGLRAGVVVMGSFAVGAATAGFALLFWSMALGYEKEPWVGETAAVAIGLVVAVAALAILLFALRKWIDYQLFPIILFVENRGIRDALARSRGLAARSRREVLAVALASLVPFVVSGVFLSIVYKLFGMTAGSFSAQIVDLFGSAVLFLLLDPFVTVLTGLLYLKLRQTEGESIEDVLSQQFVDEELPRSRWQRKLSSGSLHPTPSGRGGASRGSGASR